MKLSKQDKDLLTICNWKPQLTSKDSTTQYVMGWFDGKNHYLHREVMERVLVRTIQKNERIDHINGDGLDNRRENLRLCTHQQNMGNQGKRSGSSAFKGVTLLKRDGSWQARVCFWGKTIHLGYYSDEKEAAKAYNKAAKKYFGEFAKLNTV